MKDTVFVTGASGYVGKLLLERLLNEEFVDKIICLDKDNLREDLKKNSKITFINKNLIDSWEDEVRTLNPNKIVHLAWQIRELYAKRKMQNKWNIEGSQKVFDFFFKEKNIKTLVHFSTVASYGAYPTNTFDTVFKETDEFRKTNYLYAEEKRIAEVNLRNSWNNYLPHFENNEILHKSVYIIRPASITGPVGRSRSSFGLQSALSGKIAKENFLFKMISKVLQFMPGTHGWARQFVYEGDIVEAVVTMLKSDKKNVYSAYNLCGRGGYIDAKEMAEILGKRVIYVPPRLIQLLSFVAWHGTLGKVPTSEGVWKAYSYPIIIDGTKMERDFNFVYKKDIRQAIKDS